MSPKPRLKTGAATHPGRTALENEDAYAIFATRLPRSGLFGQRQPIQLAIVADGISGNRAGGEASRLAVESFRQYFQVKSPDEKPVWMWLNDAIGQANSEIYRESLNDSSKRGMGSTVVAAAVEDDILYVGHVGDSRAYLMRRGKAHQLTIDHTQVQELVAAGALSPEAAQIHPERFHLTRRLGRHDEIKADLSIVDVPTTKVDDNARPQKVSSLRLERGDTILLCSDGLPLELSDETIQEIVSQSSPAQSAAQRLVEQAIALGGRDNITAVVLQWPDRRNLVGILLMLALAAIAVAYFLTTPTAPLPSIAEAQIDAAIVESGTAATVGEANARATVAPTTGSAATPAQSSAGAALPVTTPTIITQPSAPRAPIVIVPVQVVPVQAGAGQAGPGQDVPVETVPGQNNGVVPTGNLTPRATIAPTATPLPTATTAPADAPPNITVAESVAVPTAVALPSGAQVSLLSPADGSVLGGNQVFSWQADFSLAANQAFELIFWRLGEDPLTQGAGWAGLSTSGIAGLDLDSSFVQTGDFRWGVRLVQVSPYQQLQFLGGDRQVTIVKSSDSSGSSGGNGGGNGEDPPGCNDNPLFCDND